MTRIYIAAAFGERAAAKQIAAALSDLGHTITSTWFDTLARNDVSPLGAFVDGEPVAYLMRLHGEFKAEEVAA